MSLSGIPDNGDAPPKRSSYQNLISALRYADLRTLIISTLANQFGQGTSHVIIGWIVLDMTGSVALLGLAFAVRSAPNLVVGLTCGPITDRYDRRMLMKIAVLGLMLSSLALSFLVFTDLIRIWSLLGGVFSLGAFQAMYMTARQAYVYDVVGASRALSGLALIGLAQRIGQLFGSLLAGYTIVFIGGSGPFLAMGIGYLIGLSCIFLLVHVGESAPLREETILENLINYFKALKSNRLLLSLMISTAAAEILGFSHMVILPILALDVLGVGAEGLGLLNASRFVGASIGIAALAFAGNMKRPGMLLLSTLFFFGISQILLGYAETFWLAFALVALVNIMATVSDVLHQTLLQLSVPNEQRGRAMGSWVIGIGTAPIGQLEMGTLADSTNSKTALLINGAALAALALVMTILLPKLRKL
ncbi:MAG: MFS transporter [Chloroflexota bacterium]|nr:MFS transporter [Chloroflexota bacterium]